MQKKTKNKQYVLLYKVAFRDSVLLQLPTTNHDIQ